MQAVLISMHSPTERETELTQSRNSELAAVSETPGLLKGLPQQGGELKTFTLPQPIDDDGTDISLKDWQPGPRSLFEKEATAVHPNGSLKGSVRTRFTPIEPKLDEIQSPTRHSSSNNEDTPTTPRTPRASTSGTRSNSVSPTNKAESLLEQGSPHADDHHEQNMTLGNGIASSPKGGIAFDLNLDDINLENNLGSKSDRGSSLRVSFLDEVEIEQPNPPNTRNKSPSKNRGPQVLRDSKGQRPTWESSTKVRPQSALLPKKSVQPTLHGVKAKKGITAVRPRGHPVQVSALPTSEIESEYQCNGNFAGSDMGPELHSDLQVRRSLDSQFAGRGGEYDSASKLISSSLESPYQSGREDPDIFKPDGTSFLPRSNGSRKYEEAEDEYDDDEDEDMKVGMLCGGGMSDINLSGEFVRFLGKLCRTSTAQGASKSRQRGRRIARSNLSPPVLSRQDSGMAGNYAIIGPHASLKLLQECCSNGSTPSYSVHKPRKIRDHEPHRHFYKTISKTLDQKLKS